MTKKVEDSNKTQGPQLDASDVVVICNSFGLGVKKYGYNSEFRKQYESMTAQLRYDELSEFFNEWDIHKN